MSDLTLKKTTPPSMLSFQRCLNLSDGLMFSIVENDQGTQNMPVAVVRHGIRGVLGAASAHTGKGKSVANIQVTESAKLHPQASGMVVKFTLLPLPLKDALFACSDKLYGAKLQAVVGELENSASLLEVSRRYAHNILSGRWLWRNLVLGKPVIKVSFRGESIAVKGWKADGFPSVVTKEHQAAFDSLCQYLCDALSGQPDASGTIEVEATISHGHSGAMGTFEVFPSQNMLSSDKKPEGFARPLYKVNSLKPSELFKLLNPRDEQRGLSDTLIMGEAALRDQKIANAIRTIDTWYVEGRESSADVDPIPVEPNGASLRDNDFYRITAGKSGYDILGRIDDLLDLAKSCKSSCDTHPKLMYAAALICRGGVFSGESETESGKEKRSAKGKRGSKADTPDGAESQGAVESGLADSGRSLSVTE